MAWGPIHHARPHHSGGHHAGAHADAHPAALRARVGQNQPPIDTPELHKLGQRFGSSALYELPSAKLTPNAFQTLLKQRAPPGQPGSAADKAAVTKAVDEGHLSWTKPPDSLSRDMKVTDVHGNGQAYLFEGHGRKLLYRPAEAHGSDPREAWNEMASSRGETMVGRIRCGLPKYGGFEYDGKPITKQDSGDFMAALHKSGPDVKAEARRLFEARTLKFDDARADADFRKLVGVPGAWQPR
jgi:hypothetical protein